MSLKSYTKDSPFPPLQESNLRLYNMRFCPDCKRTLLVLEHKNIPYEVVNINLESKPDWFLKRNPDGTVPTLEKGGKVIYEAPACCEWLDDVYPDSRLTPSDPYERAQDRMLFEYFGRLVHHLHTFSSGKKEEDREKALTQMPKHYQRYEDALVKRGGTFFGGSSPSLLDFYLFPDFEEIGYFAIEDPRAKVKDTAFPTLANWYSSMMELPIVKKLHIPSDIYISYFNTFKSDDKETDFDVGL